MQYLRQCLPTLNWQIVAIVGAGVIGLLVCGVPSALITGGLPILLVVACLLPCLLPLFLLRNKRQPAAEVQTADEQSRETVV